MSSPEALDQSAHDQPAAATFAVDAEADPGLLPRLLEPFALRNLVPDAVTSVRHGNGLRVEIRVAGLTRDEVPHLALRLANVVPVTRVLADID